MAGASSFNTLFAIAHQYLLPALLCPIALHNYIYPYLCTEWEAVHHPWASARQHCTITGDGVKACRSVLAEHLRTPVLFLSQVVFNYAAFYLQRAVLGFRCCSLPPLSWLQHSDAHARRGRISCAVAFFSSSYAGSFSGSVRFRRGSGRVCVNEGFTAHCTRSDAISHLPQTLNPDAP